MGIQTFRDLRVWQAGIDLVERVYRMSNRFPRSETYGLASQIQRAAVSIPANFAEGRAREHTYEYYQHVCIARGSLAELVTHLEIAVRLNDISRDHATGVADEIEALSRQLTALRDALHRKLNGVS